MDTLRDQQSPQTQRIAQLLSAAQEQLPPNGQSAPRLDFSQQSSGSGQCVQSDLRIQQGTIDVEFQSVVPSLPPVEKPIFPIRRPARKHPPPATIARPKSVVPAKKPRLAASRMDQLETDVTTMKASMDSFMAQMGMFMQNFQGPPAQPRQRLQPSTVVLPLVPQAPVPRVPAAPAPVPAPMPPPVPQSTV